MSKRKIALIGHSGVGKSICLLCLGGDPNVAEMDKGLGTGKSPPMQRAVEWMINNSEDVLVVSVHEQMLDDMAQAKEKGDNKDFFCKVFFIYLYTSKEELAKRLRKPNAQGCCRDENHITGVIGNSFERLDKIFGKLADHIIDTTNKDICQVVENVKVLHSKRRA